MASARRGGSAPFFAAALTACSASTFGWQGRPTTDLVAYQAAFARDVGDAFTAAATRVEFLAQTDRAEILWLGDHHRDALLHDEHLRLLDDLRRRGRRLSLCLEAVGLDDQPVVDAFLAGRCDLDTATRRLSARWRGCWLANPDVDAPFYRELLRFARRNDAPVHALEPTPRLPLAQRDEAIAASVQRAVARRGDRLVVVVVGQAHLLGQGRLPVRVGAPSVVLGATPPHGLTTATLPRSPRGFLRSDGGLWFFADLVP